MVGECPRRCADNCHYVLSHQCNHGAEESARNAKLLKFRWWVSKDTNSQHIPAE